MNFLKDLTTLSRADERVSDLSNSITDTKQLSQLSRHSPRIQQPQPVSLLNEIQLPHFLSQTTSLHLVGPLIIAEDSSRVFILDSNSNSIFNFTNQFASKLISATLSDNHLLILFENSITLLKSTLQNSETFSTDIDYKQISFKKHSSTSYNFKLIIQQEINALATSSCALNDKFFISTNKGIIIFQNGKLQISLLSNLNSLLKNNIIIQLVADQERNLIFALTNQGAIQVFTPNLKSLKSSIKQSEIVSICVVSLLESSLICLCGIDKNGSISYFQNNEQNCSFVEILSINEIAQFECLKSFSQRSEKLNLKRYLKLAHCPGVSLMVSESEVNVDIVDSSKKVGICQNYGISVASDEEIKGVSFIHFWKTGAFLFNQYNQEEIQFYVLTNKKLRIFGVKSVFRLLQEILEQREGYDHYLEVYQLFKQIYGETETLAMLIYLRCVELKDYEIYKLQQLAQVKYEQRQQELTVKSRQAQVLLEKLNSQEFTSAAKLLVMRISWFLLNFQFIYVPEQNQKYKPFLNDYFIPFSDKALITKQAPPYIPFNHCQIFEIAMQLQNIHLFIMQAQDFSQKQESLTEISQSLEYFKEFLFFLALSLSPQNIPRILPEFLEISNFQGNYTDLPIILTQNAAKFLQCDKHNVKFYLEGQNRHSVEALVRRLNLVTTDNQTVKQTTLVQKQSFQSDFNSLCKVLSQVFQKRLSALQLLEQASSANSVVKRQNVQEACQILTGKYNLLQPLKPLQLLFYKCEALNKFVNLILNAKSDQIKLFSTLVQQNVVYQQQIQQTIDSNINAGVSLFNNMAGKQQDIKVWQLDLENQENVIAPYVVKSSFEGLLSQIKVNSNGQKPVNQISFNLQANTVNSSMNEEQCKELFEALQTVLTLVQNNYLFTNLDKKVRLIQINVLQENQLFSKGINIIQSAVQSCKDQFWHYELYRFIYYHYYMNYSISEILTKRNEKGNQIEIYKTVFKRAKDALTLIVSPYIKEFLKNTDTELYLKYLEKNRIIPEYCNCVYNIASQYGKDTISALPNAFIDGIWYRKHLDFSQMSQLIHSTFSKLSGNQQADKPSESLYNTQASQNLLTQTQLSQQNMLQLQEFFQSLIQLAQIQQEFIDRQKQTKETEILFRKLLNAAELDQMLRSNRHFDLSLVLQYNVIQRSQAHQFISPSWRGLFGQNQLQNDVISLSSVLVRTDLDPDSLTLPLQILIEKHAHQDQFAHFTSIFCANLFKKYQFIGRVTSGIVQLATTQGMTAMQQELAGLLAFSLLDLKQQMQLRPDDIEVNIMTVKRELSRVPRVFESWKKNLR
eukprot:EST44821.1 hypothetical protein SS50377_15267 [Spironucleus salmonicida]